jgi:quinoprotein glucose dehydrogenase
LISEIQILDQPVGSWILIRVKSNSWKIKGSAVFFTAINQLQNLLLFQRFGKNKSMRLVSLLFISLAVISCSKEKLAYSEWKIKGGTADGIQYSSLNAINPSNVKNLKLAWSYASGDADTANNRSQIQCNPIVVDGILYGTSPSLKPFAIDASTGKEIWKFSPPAKNSGLGVNRGVTYWTDGKEKRILFSFAEHLYALDALTGNPIISFGDSGRVSLKEGLGERANDLMVVANTRGDL